MASRSSGVPSSGPASLSPPRELVEDGELSAESTEGVVLGVESVGDVELSTESVEGVLLGAEADGIAPPNAGA